MNPWPHTERLCVKIRKTKLSLEGRPGQAHTRKGVGLPAGDYGLKRK